jgi:spore maturation protein CgeB
VLVADDGDGVSGHVRGLTRDMARRIGRAARERVLREHTYAHRAGQVEAILGVRA